jgi:hypothetical protein
MKNINRLVWTGANDGNQIMLELIDDSENLSYVEVGFDSENGYSPIKGNANMSKSLFETLGEVISDPTHADFAMIKSNIKVTVANLIQLL